MKSLVFRLEPKLPGIEAEYRQHYLKKDIGMVVTGIVLWIIPYLSFTYSDLIFFGLSPMYYALLGARVVYVMFSLLVVYLLEKRLTHYIEFDRVVFIWAIFSVVWNIIASLSLPQHYISELITSLVAMFCYYIFFPNPPIVRAAAPIIYSIFIIAQGINQRSTLEPALLEVIVFSFLVTNLGGVLFSSSVYNSRRIVYRAQRQEKASRIELERLASTDSLTGVLNRRSLLMVADEVFYRFRRYQRPFSILVMDLDGFKNVNDTLGHLRGDSVLVEFAELINKMRRESDALGRMGGDEFCMVLPETRQDEAKRLAERILAACREVHLTKDNCGPQLSTSIGISEVRQEDNSLDSLYTRADSALYAAKRRGRHCWVCY